MAGGGGGGGGGGATGGGTTGRVGALGRFGATPRDGNGVAATSTDARAPGCAVVGAVCVVRTDVLPR
ncbi:MAG: hypothetical protein QOI48_3536 [Solirubrobacteraceae bacterium]|nr:hypothetical protein [Solirubrobacteraceae bacterium]